MLKDALLKLGLTEEQADKVLGYHTEALASYVPKEKLEAAEAETTQLTASLTERDNQLENLRKSAGSSEELQSKLDAAIAEKKAAAEKSAADIATYKLESAIDLLLVKEGAKNIKAVKALLDTNLIKLDGESVIGIQDQLTNLRASDKYLFHPVMAGREPYGGQRSAGDEYKDNPFKPETFNLTKQGQLLKDNPELYHKLKAAAGQ